MVYNNKTFITPYFFKTVWNYARLVVLIEKSYIANFKWRLVVNWKRLMHQ